MPQVGADISGNWASASPTDMQSFARACRMTSPNEADMVLDSLDVLMPPNSSARIALYSGGTSDDDPTGASLIFEGLATNATGSNAEVNITAGGESVPQNTRVWLAWKGTNEDYLPGNINDVDEGDLIHGLRQVWGPNISFNTDTDSAWPSTCPDFSGGAGDANAVLPLAFTYSIDSGSVSVGRGRLVGGKLVGGILVRH